MNAHMKALVERQDKLQIVLDAVTEEIVEYKRKCSHTERKKYDGKHASIHQCVECGDIVIKALARRDLL